MSLFLHPLTLREARVLVKRWHRHHEPPQGGLFAIGVSEANESTPCGAVIVGKPVARMLDDGFTAEVVRCVTNGSRNACSMLYGAAWRAARALGYKRLVTYTLESEGGASLRAVGWKCIGAAGGGTWNREDRPRVDTHPLQQKLRWEAQRESEAGE